MEGLEILFLERVVMGWILGGSTFVGEGSDLEALLPGGGARDVSMGEESELRAVANGEPLACTVSEGDWEGRWDVVEGGVGNGMPLAC